jgi:hypothetical protein
MSYPAVIEQKSIVFYEDEITAVVVDVDGEPSVYVPLLPICEYLGLDWSAQNRRVRRDEILNDESVILMLAAADGRTREMMCLPLDLLNGWLFGLNVSRVKEELRPRLLQYQRECYRVLADHFGARPMARTATSSGLVQVREMGLAIVRMAEEQMAFEARLGDTETVVGEHDRRIAILEERVLSDEARITEAQASQISQAVKAVAMVLSQQSGRNEYGAIYGELYRKFEVTAYRMLPASRFEEAMAWLTEWYQAISDREVPF